MVSAAQTMESKLEVLPGTSSMGTDLINLVRDGSDVGISVTAIGNDNQSVSSAEHQIPSWRPDVVGGSQRPIGLHSCWSRGVGSRVVRTR